MNPLAREAARHVLLVRDRSTVWSIWQRGHCRLWRQGTLESPPPDVDLAPHGGWQVSLDVGCADIERLVSAEIAVGWIGRWQRSRIARDLRRRGGCDAIDWLTRHAREPARAALRRESLPAGIGASLSRLQRDGLRIESVRSVEGLVSAALAASRQPELLVLADVANVRHLLLIDGVVCFSRRLPREPGEGVSGALLETLTHAVERWTLERVRVRTIGLAGNRIAALRAEVDGVPLGAGDALAIDWSADGRAADGGHDADPAGQEVELSRWLSDLTARPARSSTRRRPDAFAELLAPRRARRSTARLWAVTIATCLIALLSAVHAVSVGRQQALRAASAEQESARVLDDIGRARVAQSHVHAEPDRALAFLDHAGALERLAPSTPAQLLPGIASVLAQRPEVLLDSIVWSQVPADEPLGTAPIDVDPARAASVKRPHETATDLELGGRLRATGSLRRAQHEVTTLMERLAAIASIERCRVERSPLMRAAQGGPARDDGEELGWRIGCRLRSAET